GWVESKGGRRRVRSPPRPAPPRPVARRARLERSHLAPIQGPDRVVAHIMGVRRPAAVAVALAIFDFGKSSAWTPASSNKRTVSASPLAAAEGGGEHGIFTTHG